MEVGQRRRETADGDGCPDASAWVEQNRSERTSRVDARGTETEWKRDGETAEGRGLKKRRGSLPLAADRFPTSPTSFAFLAIHTRPACLRFTHEPRACHRHGFAPALFNPAPLRAVVLQETRPPQIGDETARGKRRTA